MAKLQAYALQDEGLDTIAANHALGFEADCRDFSLPAAILNALGIQRIRLLSNNPDKLSALAKAGIVVVEQIPCEVIPSPHAAGYLRIKKQRMGHTLTLV
jgi:GTP cyclohydrolase II